MFVLRTGKFQFTVCLCMHVCTVCLINYINVKSVHFQKGKLSIIHMYGEKRKYYCKKNPFRFYQLSCIMRERNLAEK